MRMERVHTPAPDQHVSCGIECCYCSVPVVLLFLCDERVVPSFFRRGPTRHMCAMWGAGQIPGERRLSRTPRSSGPRRGLKG